MDPFTQGAVGALAAQLGAMIAMTSASAVGRRTAKRENADSAGLATYQPETRNNTAGYFHAALIGAVGGMAPDLDVLIRSSSDPLLALEFHRQFTHSLLAIPIIGGLAGLLAYALLGRRWRISMCQAVWWGILGCATHGVLDGCTSYGTQLLWPFSDRRIAWDLISVVDPLFTVPLAIAVFIAARRTAKWFTVAGAVWVVTYLGVAAIQHDRAIRLGQDIAAERGHDVLRLEAKPSFGNLIVWKVVYETDDGFYVDAVKPGDGNKIRSQWQGGSIAKLDTGRGFPWLLSGSQQWRDIERFRKFSAGYIAIDPDNPMRVFDVRYSMLPHRIEPMWGVTLSPQKSTNQHVAYFTQRQDGSTSLGMLATMIFE